MLPHRHAVGSAAPSARGSRRAPPHARIRCRIRCSGRSRRTARRATCSARCTSGVDPKRGIPDLVWKKLDDARDVRDGDRPRRRRHRSMSCATTAVAARGSRRRVLEEARGRARRRRRRSASIGMKPMIPATLLSMRGLPETPAMDGVLLRPRAQPRTRRSCSSSRSSARQRVLEKWMDVRALKAMLDDLAGGEQHTQGHARGVRRGRRAEDRRAHRRRARGLLKHGRTEAEYDQQMEDLLYSRNASWIAPIEKLHAEGGGVHRRRCDAPDRQARACSICSQKKGYKVTRASRRSPKRTLVQWRATSVRSAPEGGHMRSSCASLVAVVACWQCLAAATTADAMRARGCARR